MYRLRLVVVEHHAHGCLVRSHQLPRLFGDQLKERGEGKCYSSPHVNTRSCTELAMLFPRGYAKGPTILVKSSWIGTKSVHFFEGDSRSGGT